MDFMWKLGGSGYRRSSSGDVLEELLLLVTCSTIAALDIFGLFWLIAMRVFDEFRDKMLVDVTKKLYTRRWPGGLVV